MRRFIWLLLILLFFSLAAWSQTRWLVVASAPLAAEQLKSEGVLEVKLLRKKQGRYIYTVVFGDEQPPSSQLSLLKRLPAVQWVEQDQPVKVQAVPNDVSDNLNWWQSVNAAQLDMQQRSCNEVVVALLDSGVDMTHPDLQPHIWTNPYEQADGADTDGNGYVDDLHGWDAVSGSGSISDPYGHGTHVAGIVGAVNNNGEGVAGLCSSVTLLPLRFLNQYGAGYISDAVEALQYLMDLIDQGYFQDKKIILNNSWVIFTHSLAFEIMLDELHDRGVLVVNAAGNQSINLETRFVYPASYACNRLWQLTVGNAYTQENRLAGSSNYGVQTVNVSAPGVDVLSTWSGGEYRKETGTSMAAPVVSALSAMVWMQAPALTAEEVRAVIEAATDHQSAFVGKIKSRGWVNYQKSLAASQPLPLLGYVEEGVLKGVNLDQIGQLTLNGQVLDTDYSEELQGLSLNNLVQLKCGYIQAENPDIKPLYLNISPAAPEAFKVEEQIGRWVLSWQTDDNVDAVRLEGLNGAGQYETLIELDNTTQSAPVDSVPGYTQLRLVALMHCQGEDLNPVTRVSSHSASVSIGGVPLWRTQALSPAQQQTPYAIMLAADATVRFELGENTTCEGVNVKDAMLEGLLPQEGQCQLELIAASVSGETAVLALPLTIQAESLTQFVLSSGSTGLQVDVSGTQGVLGMTLEQGETTARALRVVTTEDAQGVLRLSILNLDRVFKNMPSAVELTPDGRHAQVALSDLSPVQMLEGKHVYWLPFDEASQLAPIFKRDTRCFFSSYLFGRTAWQTQLLRQFRDNVLRHLPGGTAWVAWYYAHAPGWLGALQAEPVLAQTLKIVMQRVLSPWLALGAFFQEHGQQTDAGI